MRVAKEAGALLRQRRQQPREIAQKAQFDLVTDADHAAEALIVKRLRKATPGARLLLEEGGAQPGEGKRDADLEWIVDPLDGTANYASGVPHFAVSIGVRSDNDGLLAGCVYDPMRDEVFRAAKGGGAWLNGEQITVNSTETLKDAMLATGFAAKRFATHDDNNAEFGALNLCALGVLRNGAAALDLAWTACGRFAGYWQRDLAPWALAAGALLVREAGGQVSDYALGDFELRRGEVLCSNGRIHDDIARLLRRSRAHLANAPTP